MSINYNVNKDAIGEELYNYAKEMSNKNNLSVDELLLSIIKLEDTGLFNYVGGQSTAFNRLSDNNIRTLKELFEKKQIQYGTAKMGDNYYIYDEIDGIIRLLKYKYIGVYPEGLDALLQFKVDTSLTVINTSVDYGFPGKIFNTVIRRTYPKHIAYEYVNEFYRTLKSCGFDQSSTKALMDIAYLKKVNNITLGDFLLNLNQEEVKEVFSRIPREYNVFVNILNIIVHFYNNNMKLNSPKIK